MQAKDWAWLGVGAFVVIAVVSMGVLVTRDYIGTQNDSGECVTEWVAINPLTFAHFIVQAEGGVVIAIGPNQFSEDSDLQSAIWFVRDKIMYLSFQTRTHIIEADILCIYYDEEDTFQLTYDIIAESER
jgi:hypothetical protein